MFYSLNGKKEEEKNHIYTYLYIMGVYWQESHDNHIRIAIHAKTVLESLSIFFLRSKS